MNNYWQKCDFKKEVVGQWKCNYNNLEINQI